MLQSFKRRHCCVACYLWLKDNREFWKMPESDNDNFVTHPKLSNSDTLVHTETLTIWRKKMKDTCRKNYTEKFQ